MFFEVKKSSFSSRFLSQTTSLSSLGRSGRNWSFSLSTQRPIRGQSNLFGLPRWAAGKELALNLQTNNSKQLLNVGQRCPTNLFDKIVWHKDIDKIIIRKNLLVMLPKVVNYILNLTNNFKNLFWIVWNVLWGEKSSFSSRFFSQIAPLSSLEEAVETEVFHSQTFKQTIQNSF